MVLPKNLYTSTLKAIEKRSKPKDKDIYNWKNEISQEKNFSKIGYSAKDIAWTPT